MGELEREVEEVFAEVFGELADVFGNPPSHGMVFGLLLAAREGLGQERIAERLGLSMGAVSMALRALEGFGAVERQANGGRGHATFRANRNLRLLLAGFVQNRLRPRLEASLQRVEALAKRAGFGGCAGGDGANGQLPEEVYQMILKVRSWHRKAVQLLDSADFLMNLTTKGSG